MKKFTLACSTLILSVAFVSCSKEAEQPAAKTDITGNWKFISMEGKTSTTMQVTHGTDVMKSITTSEYITQKNTGTLIIDESKMSANNFSYYINTTAKGTIYQNGTTEVFSSPFEFTVPPYNATVTYKRAGADSIYFDSGSLFADGVTTQTKAGVAKFRIDNGKLYLVQAMTESMTESDQGASAATTIQVTLTATLQKQ